MYSKQLTKGCSMERRKFLALSAVTGLYVLTGCNSSSTEVGDTTERIAFYGDTLENRILEIDVQNMTLRNEIPTIGETPYTIGRAGNEDKLYAITRGSESFDVIDMNSMEIIKTVAMQHSPRSCAFNEYNGLQLISGKNKPMTSLIDVKTDEIVAVVGRDAEVDPLDFGGSNATGHPVWLNRDTFALLDREVRMIILYRVEGSAAAWNVREISSLPTPTAPHHFVGKGADAMDNSIRIDDVETDTFYVVTEGASAAAPGGSVAPQLLKVQYAEGNLSLMGSAALDHTLDEEGAHHATSAPNGNQIYMGSSEGTMSIINIETMNVVSTISTGLGCGHTTFVPQRNLAVVTNHHDTFITVIDTATQEKIKDITVSTASINDTILQSHTSFTDLNGDFFYAFASDNGKFYEVDLSSLEVTRTLQTGGTPKQGCSLLHNIQTGEYSRVPNAY